MVVGGCRMALAIVLGVVCGLLGVLPLYAGTHIVNRMDAQKSAAGYLTPVLLALGGSIIVLAFATVVCVAVARSLALYFVLAEAGAIIVAALVYGFYRALRK